jgi:histidine decarboxylase
MRYDALGAAAAARSARPAIVAATAGTTMTEAVDIPAAVAAALHQSGIRDRHVHLDAALSGIPLALDDRWRSAVDLGHPAGPDSLCISGHKFLGTPLPCGVVLARRDHLAYIRRTIDYISGPDVTISGSRPGLAALQLWYALRRPGLPGHHARATAARELARYATARLGAIGWDCWRHEHAFTVVLRTPPAPVLARWSLATEGERSHIVCMPGVRRAQIDAFIDDLVEFRHLALPEAG